MNLRTISFQRLGPLILEFFFGTMNILCIVSHSLPSNLPIYHRLVFYPQTCCNTPSCRGWKNVDACWATRSYPQNQKRVSLTSSWSQNWLKRIYNITRGTVEHFRTWDISRLLSCSFQVLLISRWSKVPDPSSSLSCTIPPAQAIPCTQVHHDRLAIFQLPNLDRIHLPFTSDGLKSE